MKKLLVPIAAMALALTACGTSAAERASQSASASATASPGTAQQGGFPAEVDSCGEKLHFDSAPKKVLILNGTGLPNLDALGVVDKLSLRAGDKNFGTGQEELQAKYNAIQAVASSEIETGGVKVSTEVVLENKVDLVIGYEEGVDREALKKAGVQLYSPAAFCPNYSVKHATWDLIDTEVNNLASIFGVQDKAASVIEKRKADVDALDAKGKAAGATGIALYITPGQSNFYAYGTSSMVQPIFEANGLKNSYEDNTTRVFDGSMEDILKRNPDWIVLLSLEATKEQTLEAFKSFNGADRLKAVTNNQVVVLPFSLTDPPTTLSVKGATQLSQEIAGS
ncbi:ABC transporter substrate-binding protein [Arachnia propionica]|jgi:zinc ABC transport system substrate-binding protein|uniref:ABC transporter substrate-binding protein n=1 Tax=Arachnia propionica TaxID=1750 RepID=UPI00398FEE91